MTLRNPLAPPLSGALRALPYPRGGASESTLFTHRDIRTTLWTAPQSGYESQYLDMGVFWSTKRQLFLFLACCFSITRSRRQVGTQPPNAHVYYSACPRAVCNVVPDAESVPRMVCIGCRMIGSDARPKWREHYDLGAITRGH
jgi:hypothetical protein